MLIGIFIRPVKSFSFIYSVVIHLFNDISLTYPEAKPRASGMLGKPCGMEPYYNSRLKFNDVKTQGQTKFSVTLVPCPYMQ